MSVVLLKIFKKSELEKTKSIRSIILQENCNVDHNFKKTSIAHSLSGISFLLFWYFPSYILIDLQEAKQHFEKHLNSFELT